MKFDIKFNNNTIISLFIVITSIFWSNINYNVLGQSFSVGFPYSYAFYHSKTLPLNRFHFINPFLYPSNLEIQIFTFILDVCIVYFIIFCLLYIKKFFPFKKQK